MQEIIVIAAMSKNRVIGKDNAMPWSLKEDMAHFKKLTMGWPCIMGRKTWESLPKKPLPGRLNIVVSKTMPDYPDWPDDTVTNFNNNFLTYALSYRQTTSTSHRKIKVCASIKDAIQYCSDYEKIFICGGETIYRQSLDLANKIELTLIHNNYEGDAFFPEIDSACWTQAETGDFDTFSFITYTKIN